MWDIDLDSYTFEKKDVSSSSFDSSYCSQSEVAEITISFDMQKSKIWEECREELDSCKNDIEGSNIIEEDEEEQSMEKDNTHSVVEGIFASDGSISFDIWGKNLFFFPNNTDETGVWFCSDLVHLWETTISTDNGIFLVDEWKVVDWNKSMGFYMNKIETMWDVSSHPIYLDILGRIEPSPISAFTMENCEKNCHILECILALEESRQGLDDDIRHELLLKAVDEFNLLYEDKIWVDGVDDGELRGMLDKRLDGVLERGVFVG